MSGRFTPDQRLIYNAVFDAQNQVEATMKPGVSWVAMHQLAERVILRHLFRLGLCVVAGVTDEDKAVEVLMENKVGALFMPHGLGHFLGLIVHDVGGFTEDHQRHHDEGELRLR